MVSPEILTRDINVSYEEFLEWISIAYKTNVVTDPYSGAALSETINYVRLPVSWHDVATQSIHTDQQGGGILGTLSSGDAFCIYQGQVNLFNYQFTKNSVKRRGIDYVIETLTNPSGNRWILALRRIR